MYQDTEATFKIMGMLSVSKILTPDAIKKKKFSSYSSVVLVDYENLFNVNTKNMVDVTNIINTIYLSKKSVLFVFVMTKYHESTNIVKVINEMTDKNIDIIDLYISCDVDTGIQKKMCIDVHKFLEMDDYFLLKLYKYMSHFNIPVEVLSADKYNYYNGSINYLYIDMQEKKSQHMVSNPLTYYKQFITPTYKPKYIESEFDKKDYYEHPLMAPTRARKIRVDGRTVYYADDSIFDREDGIWIIDGQKYLVFPRKQ
jgi:hypothetical protein